MTKLKEIIPKKRLWILLILMLLLITTVWVAVAQVKANKVAKAEAGLETVEVTRGDIRISVSGPGTLVAGETVDLNFANPGTLEVLNVQLGDKVSEGDILAQVSGTETLELNVAAKELDLAAAQEELDKFLESTDLALAEAQLTYADAQDVYAEAQDSLRYEGQSRCDQQTKLKYYEDYLSAFQHYTEWATYLESGTSGFGTDFILTQMEPYKDALYVAEVNLAYCDAFTEQEIEESEANLQVAEANVEYTKSVYEKLKETSGLDSVELDILELKVKAAELQLEVAKTALSGATLVAPMDGTVVYLASNEIGESIEAETDDDENEIGMDTFITIADLENPLVEAYIDAVDMASFKTGNQVEVIFDAIPLRTFYGVVTQVEPMLVTFNGYDALEGMVDLLDGSNMSNQSLLIGMNAYVEVIEGESEDTLLITRDALTKQDDGSYYVNVLENDGSITQRAVTLGLMDYVNVEVLDGLEEGETVVISQDDTGE